MIGLAVGLQDGFTVGAKFRAATISGETLGILESFDVAESTCFCRVSDMINAEFWEGLYARMPNDYSPPQGTVFAGYVPEGLLDTISHILAQWETGK